MVINRATIDPDSKSPNIATQRLPVEEGLTNEIDTSAHNTQTSLTEYTVDQIVSFKDSGDVF